jgi:electron transfer flavoprotein beta subunit
MKILVPVKQVVDADTRVRIRPDLTGIDMTNARLSINPFCQIAVEAAVRIREQGMAEEVIAVTIGSPRAAEVLVTALGMGADRAILVKTDRDLQPLAVAGLLARLAERESPGLVILGKQAVDDDNNQTGQMLAGLLGWPQGTFASHVELTGTAVKVVREIDGGLETLRLRLPAVITTDLRLNEPRYVSLPNLLKARKQKIDQLDAEGMGVDISSSIEILKVEEPPRRTRGVRVASAAELVERLRDEARVI